MALITCLSFLMLPSCQKDEFGEDFLAQESLDMMVTEIMPLALSVDGIAYYGPTQFNAISAKVPYITSVTLSNLNFDYLENFVIKVENGTSRKTKVSNIEITVGGEIVINNSDFKRTRTNVISKPLSLSADGLTLGIKISGKPGTFINVLIEGTLKTGVISDIEGNCYRTVTIGNQLWMAENLKYLPSVVGPSTGSNTTPYYYVYGYDGTVVADAKATANYTTYGVLYNYPAAMNGAISSTADPSGVQGVCPTGWHLPSDLEWIILTNYLDEEYAGGKLKETGTSHWITPNIGATNVTGFTALPGGRRSTYGSFDYIGSFGFWWSATELNATDAWGRGMYFNYDDVGRNYHSKEMGFSVRCIKD